MTTKGLPEASHLPVEFMLVDVQDLFRKYISPYIDIIYILISNSKKKRQVRSIKILKQFSLNINKYHA